MSTGSSKRSENFFFLQLPRKHEDQRCYGFQVSFDDSHRFKAAFRTYETKMVMYIIISKSNSTFGTIGKATGVKMTAKAVGKNSNFCVKNNLNMSWSEARPCTVLNNFLLLNRFLRLSLNENFLLLNFLAHFFPFVPCIWEF